MKYLTDQIRDISNNLIQHHLAVRTLQKRTYVNNDHNNKNVLIPNTSLTITTRSISHKIDNSYDYIDEDALSHLINTKQIVVDGEKMLLAILSDDLQIECFSRKYNSKDFLAHRLKREEMKE